MTPALRSLRFGHDALVVLLIVWLVIPLAAILIVSFGLDTIAASGQGPTLKWYRAAWEVGSFRSGVRSSFIVATSATLVSAIIGIAAAIGLTRWESRWKGVIDMILLLPIMVPGLVIGLGMLAAIATMGGADLGYGRLIAGHLLVVMPYVLRTTYASLITQGGSLEEAARTMGASEWRVLRKVTLPLARPGIVAGMLFAFIISLDEVPLSLFLADAHTTTLPLAVLSYLQFNFDPAISAVSAAQIILTLVAAVALERLFGLKNLYGAERGSN